MPWIDTKKQDELSDIISDKKISLAYGGSRSGKTAKFCQAIVFRAYHYPSRHAILRYHFSDVKTSIGLDTLPKVLRLMGISYTLNKSDWYFVIDCKDGVSKSEIWLSGLDDKERVEKVLGREYSTIYFNEASQISYHAYTTALTRLAQNSGLRNKVFIDCNPPEKTHWLYKLFVLGKQPDSEMDLINPDLYGSVLMNPTDNPHLPEDYISEVLATLPDRQKRRFLYGEWLEKRQGALFTREVIDKLRVSGAPDYMPYAVVGVDVAISHGENADETGIVSVGMGSDGHFYVLRDSSLVTTPAEWARLVARDYDELKLNVAVYETNQGGDMVEHTIHTANQDIVCAPVRATRGKAIRAEPVVSLYEQGKVHHVGYFPELEDQMCEWTPEDVDSPDRIDALVWAMTYLMSKRALSGIQPNSPSLSSRPTRSINGAVRSRPPVFGNGFRR